MKQKRITLSPLLLIIIFLYCCAIMWVKSSLNLISCRSGTQSHTHINLIRKCNRWDFDITFASLKPTVACVFTGYTLWWFNLMIEWHKASFCGNGTPSGIYITTCWWCCCCKDRTSNSCCYEKLRQLFEIKNVHNVCTVMVYININFFVV